MSQDPPTINQLWKENQRLQQQNLTLKESLQQLIAVNSQLTQSIQEYSNNNALQSRVRQLQNQNRALRNNLNGALKKKNHNEESYQSNKQAQQMAQVIKQLMQSSKAAKIAYQKQIATLTEELQIQHNHLESTMREIQARHGRKIQQYQSTISQLKNKNEALNQSMQKKMLKQSQQIHQQRKNLKVSTTIQDMRHVYEKQMQQKDYTIQVYENVLQKLKQKLKQKY